MGRPVLGDGHRGCTDRGKDQDLRKWAVVVVGVGLVSVHVVEAGMAADDSLACGEGFGVGLGVSV